MRNWRKCLWSFLKYVWNERRKLFSFHLDHIFVSWGVKPPPVTVSGSLFFQFIVNVWIFFLSSAFTNPTFLSQSGRCHLLNTGVTNDMNQQLHSVHLCHGPKPSLMILVTPVISCDDTSRPIMSCWCAAALYSLGWLKDLFFPVLLTLYIYLLSPCM